MPRPSSRTTKRAFESSASTRISIRPPCGEYLIALSSRLVSTWRVRSASPATLGSTAGTTTSIVVSSPTLCRAVSATAQTRSSGSNGSVTTRREPLSSWPVLAQRQGRAVERGQRRPQLVRHRGDELRAELLEPALARDVPERIHGALGQGDADDRQPEL